MKQSDPGRSSTPSRVDWMALSWGFLEAVTLFVVPDTWITRQALISRRAGMIAAGWSLVGALVGGLALYLAAMRYQAELLAFYDWLPGIGPTLTSKAAVQLHENGVLALLLGGYTGTPFKLFAAQANAAGIRIMAFAVVAVISRGSRFVLSAFVASIIAGGAGKLRIHRHVLLWAHAVVWTVFYAAYWWSMWD